MEFLVALRRISGPSTDVSLGDKCHCGLLRRTAAFGVTNQWPRLPADFKGAFKAEHGKFLAFGFTCLNIITSGTRNPLNPQYWNPVVVGRQDILEKNLKLLKG